MAHELENQEIRIKIENGRYSISRYDEHGKVKEQYRPETNETTQVWLLSILNGFQPPRTLDRLDKLSD